MSPGIALRPTAWEVTQSLLERQTLRPYPRPTESESAFYPDPQVIHMHLEKLWVECCSLIHTLFCDPTRWSQCRQAVLSVPQETSVYTIIPLTLFAWVLHTLYIFFSALHRYFAWVVNMKNKKYLLSIHMLHALRVLPLYLFRLP